MSPCRFSTVRGVVEVVERAGVQPRGAPGEGLYVQGAVLQVGAVDVGELKLSARGELERLGDLHGVAVVEVQPGHREVGLRLGSLLLEGDRRAVLVGLHHAIG